MDYPPLGSGRHMVKFCSKQSRPTMQVLIVNLQAVVSREEQERSRKALATHSVLIKIHQDVSSKEAGE